VPHDFVAIVHTPENPVEHGLREGIDDEDSQGRKIMKAIAITVLTLLAGSAQAAQVGSVGGGYTQTYQLGQETQRLQLCNEAMQRYLAGRGPQPPAMCSAPVYRAPPQETYQDEQPIRRPLNCTTWGWQGNSTRYTDCY